MVYFNVTGMSCAACQARVEKAVGSLPGVTSCAVSLLTNSMGVEGTASERDIIKAVEKAGYRASVRGEAEAPAGGGKAADGGMLPPDTEKPALVRRLILSAVFLLVLMYITMGHHMLSFPLPAFFEGNPLALTLMQLLLAAAVMIINRRFFESGIRALFSGAPNMDTLVALGSAVSFGWSTFVFFKMCGMSASGAEVSELAAVAGEELYFESAAMIPALITVGKLLEAVAKGKTTDALRDLIKLKPARARLVREGEETEVDAASLLPGDIFALKPGDSIPADGVVVGGNSSVDESALTGESIPVGKAEGDTVSAATVNVTGYLRCRVTRVGEDMSISRIIKTVADASATKAPIARVADKVSGVFVPAVMAIAAAVTAGWLIAGAGVSDALARGISVLVISCPCALGLATPVAIMVGNGLGAKNGILIRTGEALETVGKTDIAVLDKTGTVTSGKPVVTDILPAEGFDEAGLLRAALSVEAKSSHPLALAIAAEGEARGILPADVSDFTILPGKGIEAVLEGSVIRAGNRGFISESCAGAESLFEAGERLAAGGKTPLYFSCGDRPAGMIAVADVIKPGSAEAVKQLGNLGVEVVMLTGDNPATAAYIGESAGIGRVAAGLMPEDKSESVDALRKIGKVAMVGDGINDAPAIMKSDVGIAIGAGTDVAVDSASVVLVNSDLSDVPAVIRLGRAVLRNVYENLFWAFFYNIVFIPLAAGLFGLKMKPMYGAAAMSLSSVTVCLNALRLKFFKMKDPSRDRPRRRRGGSRAGDIDDALRGLSAGCGTACAPGSPSETGSEAAGQVVISVGGMMCGHCEAAVSAALEKLDFISSAKADHASGRVEIMLSGVFDGAAVKAAVEAEDYTYGGIKKT